MLKYKSYVYHYTSLDSAIKIILSNSLRFGDFKNMNDIAESRRVAYDNINSYTAEKIITKYKSISLTDDNISLERGFAIDTLWGYYADKGRGVCLIFDKEKLFKIFQNKNKLSGLPLDYNISYIDEFSDIVICQGNSIEEIEKDIEKNIQNIFFTKKKCWKHEQEIRLLTKSDSETFLDLEDSLIGTIISTHRTNFQKSNQYKLLEELKKCRNFNIYNYTTELGNKVLINENNNKIWPNIELDI